MKQKQIVDQIADRCTLTGSDIKAVLDALMVVIKRNLANGSPVRLGDLGSLFKLPGRELLRRLRQVSDLVSHLRLRHLRSLRLLLPWRKNTLKRLP